MEDKTDQLRVLPAADLFGGWSRTLPSVEGFYWYREEGSKPEVIFWEQDMQWVRTAGSDIPMGADMTHKIEGEFWSVMLNPPNAEVRHGAKDADLD